MASAKRIDPEDTVDNVIFGIVKLQKEGWALVSLSLDFAYQEPQPAGQKPKKHKLPVEATMVVRLWPA